jgi:hypothetical protein
MVLAFGVAALGACHRQQQNQAATQDMSIEDNLSANGADTNADIETLPPDESVGTPSNQLVNGADNPDVNVPATNSD